MKRSYLNEKHRQYSEACQQDVQEMMDHPLSREEKEEQMRRNKFAMKSTIDKASKSQI